MKRALPAILIVILILGCRGQRTPRFETELGFWAWGEFWPDDQTMGDEMLAVGIDFLYRHTATLRLSDSGEWQAAERWKGPGFPDRPCPEVRFTIRIEASNSGWLSNPDQVDILLDLLRRLVDMDLRTVENFGHEVKRVQVDYDCPESGLGAYARFIRRLKTEVFPKLLVEITALPVWIKRKQVKEVIESADGVTVMFFANRRPDYDLGTRMGYNMAGIESEINKWLRKFPEISVGIGENQECLVFDNNNKLTARWSNTEALSFETIPESLSWRPVPWELWREWWIQSDLALDNGRTIRKGEKLLCSSTDMKELGRFFQDQYGVKSMVIFQMNDIHRGVEVARWMKKVGN